MKVLSERRCVLALAFVLAWIAVASPAAHAQAGCRNYDRRYQLICVEACPEVEVQVLSILQIGEIYRVYRTQRTSCPPPMAPPIDPCDLYGESGPYVEYVYNSLGYVNGWVDVKRIDPDIVAPPGTKVYLKLLATEGCFDTPFTCPAGGGCNFACAQDCIATPWLFADGPAAPHPTFLFDLLGPGTDPDGCSEERLAKGQCKVEELSANANLLCPGDRILLTARLCNVAPPGAGGCATVYKWGVYSSDASVIDAHGLDGEAGPVPPGDPTDDEDDECLEITVELEVEPDAEPGRPVTLTFSAAPEDGARPCEASLTLTVAPTGSNVCGRIDVVFIPVNYPHPNYSGFLNSDVPRAIEEFATKEPFAEYFEFFNFHTVIPPDASTVPNPYTAPDVDEIVYIWNGIAPGEQVYAAQCTPAIAFCYPHPGNGIATIVSSESLGRIMFGLGQSFYPALGVETPGFDGKWILGEGPVADTPNLSTITTVGSLKWEEWIEPPPEPAWFIDCTRFDDWRTPIPTPDCWQFPPGSPEVGMFEGAFDYAKRLYRPAFGCLLNDNSPVFDFCPVCKQALISGFYAYESIPMFSVIEPQSPFTPTGSSTTFRVDPNKDGLAIWWFVDGAYQAGLDGEEFVLEHCDWPAGIHTVEVMVADLNPCVRRDLYGGMAPQSTAWTVELGGTWGGVLRVPEDFPTLAQAVDAATSGSTILLATGLHRAADVVVPCDRSITIEGEGMHSTFVTADLDGDGIGDGRILDADGAGALTVRGMTLHDGKPVGPNPGGALRCVNSSGLIIESCRFAGNQALLGSAVFAGGLPLVEIENCLFAGNDSTGQAGTVYVSDSDLVLKNVTLARNEGGGLDVGGVSDAQVRNSILADNGPFGVRSENALEVRYSTFFDNTLDVAGAATADPATTQVADPLFVDAGHPNPLIADFHLTAASPCIDGGDPADPFPLEPSYAGCAINQGAFGGTPEAQTTDVLSTGVSPAVHYVAPGMSRVFQAYAETPAGLLPCNNGVTWSLDPAVGTITADGLFTAPYPLPSLDPVTVTATFATGDTASATIVFVAVAADGDFDGDGWVQDTDLSLLGDYVFSGGVWPAYRESGDWNGDGAINEDDYFDLEQHLADNGPTPAIGAYDCGNPAHYANELGEFVPDPFCP